MAVFLLHVEMSHKIKPGKDIVKVYTLTVASWELKHKTATLSRDNRSFVLAFGMERGVVGCVPVRT